MAIVHQTTLVLTLQPFARARLRRACRRVLPKPIRWLLHVGSTPGSLLSCLRRSLPSCFNPLTLPARCIPWSVLLKVFSSDCSLRTAQASKAAACLHIS
jgi:hypothetical protein